MIIKQSVLKKHVKQHLWWVCIIVLLGQFQIVFAGECDTTYTRVSTAGIESCGCKKLESVKSSSGYFDDNDPTNHRTIAGSNVGYCNSASDTVCNSSLSNISAGTHRFKNTSSSCGQYYECYWQNGSAFTGANFYNPTGLTPSVQLSISASSGTEAAGTTIIVTATASSNVSSNQTMDIAVSGIDASDYSLSSSIITIASGNNTGSVNFTIQNDSLDENNETAKLTISNPSTGITICAATQNITITDNDAAPTVQFTTANQSSAENGGAITATLQLSAVSGKNISIPFTVSGTTGGTDYSITTSPITISAGDTTSDITVTINDDSIDEADETVIVNIGKPTNATTSGTTTHTATIQDNDLSFVINEIEYENKDADEAEFVELKNISGSTIDFSSTPYTLQFLQDDASVRKTMTLDSGIVADNDYFVICNDDDDTDGDAKVYNCDQDEADANFLQNSTEAVVLKLGDFIVDTVSYEGNVTGYVEGTAAIEDDETEVFVGLSRFPDGTDTNDNSADFAIKCITPGTANSINDSSGCYAISINDPTAVTEGDSGTKTIDFTVSLSHAAVQDVTVDYATANDTAISGSDYTSITSTVLTFSAGTNKDKTFTVIFSDDEIDEGTNETFNINLTNNSSNSQISDNQGIGTITDDDTADFTVTEIIGTLVSETGTTDTFTVILNSKPMSDVEISVTSADSGEATVDKSTLTFTAGNWDTAQTVTVTGIDDIISDGDQTTNVTLTVVDTNSDDQYDPVDDQTVDVMTMDDDMPGITVNPITLIVGEPSGTANFTIKLNTPPNGNSSVTVPLSTSPNCTILPASSITITNENWDTGETITVTAVNDDIDNTNNRTCTITTGDPTSTGTSADTDYNGLDVANVNVSVQDDDMANIYGTNLGGSISLTEGGVTGSYDIKLSTQPSGDVEITITADAQTELSKDAGINYSNSVILTFTNSDWNTTQTITVQAIDDANVEGSHNGIISHAITGTVNDINYPTSLSLTLGNITTNITDNDNPLPINTGEGEAPSSTPLPDTMTVFTKFAGQGSGTISSSPSGINCKTIDEECNAKFETASHVKLTAKADVGSIFDRWSSKNCDKEMFLVSSHTCTAYFKAKLAEPIVITPVKPTVPDVIPPVTDTDPIVSTTSDDILATPEVNETTISTTVNTVSFSEPSYEVAENSGQTEITVTRIGTEGKVSVELRSSEDDRHKQLVETLVWDDGIEGDLSVSITIIDNNIVDGNQEVILSLGAGENADFSEPNTAVLTIVDDDTVIDILVIDTPAKELVNPSVTTTSSIIHDCNTSGILNEGCDANGKTITDLKIEEDGELVHGVIDAPLENNGRLSNVTVTEKGSTIGGKVTGYVKNLGLMTDFVFVGGDFSGANEDDEVVGTIAGLILNNSKIGGSFADVYLGPNTHIIGGILERQIIGDREQPAILENLLIKPNSTISNVIIGDDVEWKGVVFRENVTFSIHRDYMKAHEIVQLPALGDSIIIDYNGKYISISFTKFTGGASENSGIFKRKTTIKRKSQVTIKSNLLVDVRHINEQADILVVAVHTVNGKDTFYMLNSDGKPVNWNGHLDDLIAFQSNHLSTVQQLDIWNNPLDLTGSVIVYIGYRFADGKIIYSPKDMIEMDFIE